MGEPMDRDLQPWFGRERPFDKAFPQLEQALIAYYEVGDGIYKDNFKREVSVRLFWYEDFLDTFKNLWIATGLIQALEQE